MHRLRSHPEALLAAAVLAFVVATMVDSYRRRGEDGLAAARAALPAVIEADRDARVVRPVPGEAATFRIPTREGGFWLVGGKARRSPDGLDDAVAGAMRYGAGAWPGEEEVFVHTPRRARATRVRVVVLGEPQPLVRRRGAGAITDVDLDARRGRVLARPNRVPGVPVVLKLKRGRYRARVSDREGTVRIALWRTRTDRAPVVHVRRR